MYVRQTARYLGDPMRGSGMPAPSPARLAELSTSCAAAWKAYKKGKPKHFPHLWRAFLAANPICREGIAIRWGYQPSASPCGDANSGLLIDCWDAALQKGVTLGSLGRALSQPQLDRAVRAYRNMGRAQQVALRNPTGYYFNGRRMVRNGWNNRLTLGQDDDFDVSQATDIFDTGTTSSSIPLYPAVDPTSDVPYSQDILSNTAVQPITALPASGPAPLSDAWWNQVTSPSSSASGSSASPLTSLINAAGGIISSAVAPGSSQVRTGQQQQNPLQNSTIISGVPNVIVYGAAAFLVLIMAMGGRRR
jgi:hypothetical protein